MHFYNLIKKYEENLDIFVDMDGVIAEYNLTEKLDFKNKRPLKTNIQTLEEISKLNNINLYILSICKKNSEIKDKMAWLDKYAPYFKPENRVIISKEQEINKSSKELKYAFLKNHVKKDRKMIVVDDDNGILKYLKEHLKEATLYQDSSLID